MRPYTARREENKYVQPVISNASGIQPSPLALLAATCSRIGDTFHEETAIFTQKNLAYEKGKEEITLTKSCIDTRPNTLAGLDRMFDVQQHASPPFPPASITTSSPYFKVKQEENIDYENCEGIHICPNVIAEARMLETQARASFGKSCSHDPPPVCSHNPEPPSGNVSYNSPGCDHNVAQGHLSNSPTSCFYDSCSQSSSCAVDSSSFQGSVLAHLPFSGSAQSHTTNLDNYPRQKDYHSWPNQQQFYRSNSSYTSNEPKSSCMMRENYDNINSPLQNLHSSTPERSFRTSLSHMSYPSDNPLINLRSHTPSGSQTPHQYLQSTLAASSQPQSFPHPNFNTSPDVKPYSYQMHPQNVRQPMSPPCVTPPINYSQSQNMSPIHPPAAQALPPVNMSHHLHNHPAGMPSSFCSTCNSQANSMGLPTNPDGVPVNPMMNPELQAQSLTEYQYQQQQMFYARDNRRPRRIACTCPNCRDGENKTVTTKDGKQRKLHVCHIPGCGKIYGKTSHLRAHLRWHAGERPFACNWLFCNKRFTRSDELQRHRRTHTGDKRFECSICLKKFMRSDHLSKHMKTHQSHNKQTKDKTEATAADKTKQQPAQPTQVVKIKTTEEEAPKSSDTMGISESMKL